MADQILFDRLAYIDRLTRAGIGEDHARAHAEAIDEALREAVATKADLTAVTTDLAHRIEVGLRDMTIKTCGMVFLAVGVLLGFKFFG